MPFDPSQQNRIIETLNPKLVNPCPVCAQKGTRQLQSDLTLITLSNPIQQPAQQPSKWGLEKGLLGIYRVKEMPPPGTVDLTSLPVPPTVLPCVVLICMNCGHTELFNVHVLVLLCYKLLVPWDLRFAASNLKV